MPQKAKPLRRGDRLNLHFFSSGCLKLLTSRNNTMKKKRTFSLLYRTAGKCWHYNSRCSRLWDQQFILWAAHQLSVENNGQQDAWWWGHLHKDQNNSACCTLNASSRWIRFSGYLRNLWVCLLLKFQASHLQYERNAALTTSRCYWWFYYFNLRSVPFVSACFDIWFVPPHCLSCLHLHWLHAPMSRSPPVF